MDPCGDSSIYKSLRVKHSLSFEFSTSKGGLRMLKVAYSRISAHVGTGTLHVDIHRLHVIDLLSVEVLLLIILRWRREMA